MKLSKLYIQNFRKLNNVEIICENTTFLIGANNAGKTSTLSALEYLLTDKKLDSTCRSQYKEDDSGEIKTDEREIIIEGEFQDVPLSIINVRGFKKERLHSYTKEDGSIGYMFNYRVRFGHDGKQHREMRMYKQKMQPQYESAKTYQDLINAGAAEALFEGKELSHKITAKDREYLEDSIPELFEVDASEEWFENPGGIPGNVLSVLPRFLKIKADVLMEEVQPKSGTLFEILSTLFEDVRKRSKSYEVAKNALAELQKEMDPNNTESDFGQLMSDLNNVVDSVFPSSSINVTTDLTSADSLKPQFSVELCSNVGTTPDLQGTGLVRSAVFALLRFRQQWNEKNRDGEARSLIIGFEEPELFLHPNAANSMRDTIYSLAGPDCQILSTTHSPYMIDLSKSDNQVLNSYCIGEKEFTEIVPFNHSDAFRAIADDDKMRVKMLQKIDDYVARAFFAQKVIIVEGDTECIVFKKTIEVMPEIVKKAINDKYQIIKAGGKAVIISFAKYLRAMQVDIFVIHDEDSETPSAVKMNNPILAALDNDFTKRLMMHNCIEDELGYPVPSSEKPYHAYQNVRNWKSWEDVPVNWKNKMKIVFSEFASEL